MALLTKHDPFSELFHLTNWLDKELSGVSKSPLEKRDGNWHPAVDIMENENEYIIKAELPEVDEEAIDMTVEKGILTLQGKRQMETEKTENNYTRMERHYGTFRRTFRLPDSVDTENVKANMRQGVLIITLPKKEETKPRTIQVKTK